MLKLILKTCNVDKVVNSWSFPSVAPAHSLTTSENRTDREDVYLWIRRQPAPIVKPLKGKTEHSWIRGKARGYSRLRCTWAIPTVLSSPNSILLSLETWAHQSTKRQDLRLTVIRCTQCSSDQRVLIGIFFFLNAVMIGIFDKPSTLTVSKLDLVKIISRRNALKMLFYKDHPSNNNTRVALTTFSFAKRFLSSLPEMLSERGFATPRQIL